MVSLSPAPEGSLVPIAAADVVVALVSPAVTGQIVVYAATVSVV